MKTIIQLLLWFMLVVIVVLSSASGLAGESGAQDKRLIYEDAKKSLKMSDYMGAIDSFTFLDTYENSKDYVIYAWALL